MIIMVARVDPTKAKYFPELLPESLAITASASGVNIASYANFSPYVIFLQNIMTGQTPGVTLRVDNDSGHATLESPLVVRPGRQFVENDIISYDSLDLWAVGTAFETYYTYTMKVAKLTVVEKIKHGLSLDDSEQALAAEFDLVKKLQAGILRRSLEVEKFKKVYEVAREVTVAAGGTTRVGRMINVKKGQKAVLLGIAVDQGMIDAGAGGPGADDTYFDLNRDTIDTNHIRLDCMAMPSIDTEVPCYIPALDRHEILIESATGVTNLPVRYRYGIADLSLLEKIRWGVGLTKEERAVADQFDLESSVQAGVL